MAEFKDKTLELGCFGLVITYSANEGSAVIESDMLEEGCNEEGCNEEYKAAVYAIESIVLAHFQAGVDVTTPAYIEGIETAYLAIANRY